MTMEEINKGNKIIAEFMGAKWHEHPINKDESEFIFPISPDPSSTFKQRINLRYHSEWNWLMPVVKKCLTVGDNSDMWDILFNALSMVEIDSLFGAVVDFIKWYNENKE